MEHAATALAHESARQMFGPLVDHELAAADAAALRSHLHACPECQEGLVRYQRAVSLVRETPRLGAPADFAHRVMKRIRKRRRAGTGPQGEQLLGHWNASGEAVAAVVLAALAAALVIFALL